MRLSDLKSGQEAVIVKILGHGAFRKRVMEMGFVKGRKITAILSAPLRDPVKYRLMGYEVSLRRSEASMIEVIPYDEGEDTERPSSEGRLETTEEADRRQRERYEGQRHIINIALIGNPNCGKTSLFNIASGAQEHVGNYSGVTVDAKSGVFRHGGYTFNITDLPGTYSLSAYSPEERYVRKYLRDNSPDVIVNVVDGSNLERNLYLTTELIDMDYPMVIALNMFDEMRAKGVKFEYENFGNMVGVPVVPTVCRNGEGIDHLFDTIIEVYERRHTAVRHVHVRLGNDLEEVLTEVKDRIKADKSIHQHYSPRYLAIKLLEGDPEAEEAVRQSAGGDEIIALRDKQLHEFERTHPDEDVSSIIAAEKYGFISGALAETLETPTLNHADRTHVIDAVVTNRLFGFPFFLAVMFFVFWFTFTVGSYPQDWIQTGVDWLAAMVNDNMPDGPLKDLLANGIIGGVGGVIVFLPNILILFFFISFMEDSGYMARAAFIMDRLMHKIGLHGKSFIPLVMGFGCNVPAIMACRELPPYRVPTMKTTLRHMWGKGKEYLNKMGGIILLASIIVWALNFFPLRDTDPTEIAELNTEESDEINPERDSYLEMMGKAVNPILEPLGFSWRATVAAIAGVPAKEIVVSTLGVLYTGSDEATEASLSERLSTPLVGATEPDFNAASALAFMIFILLYCPCTATLVAIVRETRSWRYGLFAALYNTALAWVLSFLIIRQLSV